MMVYTALVLWVNRQIKETEGNRLLSHIRDTDYVITLAIEGKMLDSVELSDLIARLGVQGKSSIAFVIGGSLGLSDAVLMKRTSSRRAEGFSRSCVHGTI